MTFKPGDVVLVNFPFTDLSSSKLRPAVVIVTRGADVIIIGIFSKLPDVIDASHFIIEEKAGYFPMTGLKKTSIIKTDKIAVIHQSNIKRQLGKLPDDVFGIIKAKLKETLELK